MRTLATLFLVGLLASGLGPAAAFAQTFFGEDLNDSDDPGDPGDDPVPLAVYPNAAAARAEFLALLSAGVETESFEALAKNTLPPFDLTFGADTAALSGAGEVLTTPFSGVYPIEGANFYFLFLSSGSAAFRVDFSAPQAAFGFFMTDVGDGLGQLTLTFERSAGGSDVVVVPTTVGAGTGSVAFFGRIDAANPFTAVTFSNPSTGDGFGFDELTIASPAQLVDEVASYFLPSKVAYKPNASEPTEGKLVSAGVFDTGPEAVDLTGAATLEVGGLTVPIASLPPKGAGFLFREGGVTLSLKPARTGSSRAKFKLVVLGDLTSAVNPNQALPVSFANTSVDAGGVVTLADGGFKLGRQRGALIEPAVHLAKARAKLADAGPDSFALTAGIATDGQTPAAASDVTVGFGDAFAATVPASAFARSGERWIGSVELGDGSLSVVLDYLRETATVKAKAVELGGFAQGPLPLRVGLSVGDAARAVTVRAVRKGASLRY